MNCRRRPRMIPRKCSRGSVEDWPTTASPGKLGQKTFERWRKGQRKIEEVEGELVELLLLIPCDFVNVWKLYESFLQGAEYLLCRGVSKRSLLPALSLSSYTHCITWVGPPNVDWFIVRVHSFVSELRHVRAAVAAARGFCDLSLFF